MVATRSPLHVPDLAVKSNYLKIPGVVDLVKLGRIRTLLIVPMLSNNAVVGAITVSRTRVQPFTEKEIEMVADFAAQATIALETTRLERQYREMQMQLAHANRVATMGQLSASIAHELRQPLSAVVSNGGATLRWLTRKQPEVEEAKQAVERIITDASRASEVCDRIHRLVKKDPLRTETLDINDAILEVIPLIPRSCKERRYRQEAASRSPVEHSGRSGSTSTSDPQLDHQCHSGDERYQGYPRVIHWDRECQGRRCAHNGAGHRAGVERGEPSTSVRTLLHNEAKRHGPGTFNLPVDH
jgi:signal transduction histidine kinase